MPRALASPKETNEVLAEGYVLRNKRVSNPDRYVKHNFEI